MAMQEEKIKWVEGTPFMVDGFRFTNPRCQHYFLTHFHSDHTTGLYKNFSAGKIYASVGTANLVTALIGVNAERVVALPMNKPVMIAGFEVTLIDANHCPAAVMLLFRDPRPGGRTHLHTGDFRADKSVCTNPLVKALRGRVDSLYLDTTYCGPQHAFPSQQEVLAQAAHLVRTELRRDPNTLFLVGTYSIGKEKVLEAVAKAAGSRCLVTARKARMMRLSGAWDESIYTTHDVGAGGIDDGAGHARVRAVALQNSRTSTALQDTLAEARASGAPFTSVVGVRPTGWTHHNSAKEGEKVARESARRERSIELSEGVAGSATVKEEKEEEEEELTGFRHSCEDSGEGGEDEDDKEAVGVGGAGDGGGGGGGGGRGERVEEAEGLGFGLQAWNMGEPRVRGNVREYSLPYSEHSSYVQLKDFVRTVRPKKIIPTVNASSGPAVEKILKYFLEFMDLSQDRKRLDSYFSKPSSSPLSSTARSPRGGGSSGNRSINTTGGSGMSIIPPTTAKRARNVENFGTPNGALHRQSTEPCDRKYGGSVLIDTCSLSLSPPPPPPPIPSSSRVDLTSASDDARRLHPPHRTVCAPASAPATSAENAFVDVTAIGSSNGAAGNEVVAITEESEPEHASSSVQSSEAVELNLVDVQAQKAILTDIERRKRLRLVSTQQGCLRSTEPLPHRHLTSGAGLDTERRQQKSRPERVTPCDNAENIVAAPTPAGGHGGRGEGTKSTGNKPAPAGGCSSKSARGREGRRGVFGRAAGIGNDAAKKKAKFGGGAAASGSNSSGTEPTWAGHGSGNGGGGSASSRGSAIGNMPAAEACPTTTTTIRDFFGRRA